jgi:hypothetical protein
LRITSNESAFEYSIPEEFLDKKYEIALIKLDGDLEINKKININWTNNKFNYIVSGPDQNNNSVKEENVIDIPNGKYDFNELIMTINRLLKKDKCFFKASLENGKVIIEITKSAYSIDFSKQNTLANVFGFSSKVLTHGKHISENKINPKAVDKVFICCSSIYMAFLAHPFPPHHFTNFSP